MATPLIAGRELRLRMAGFNYTCQVHEHPSANTPVFFVSGAFQSMGSWRKFADHFAQFTTVILCDLPGTGASDSLPYEFGLDFLANAMAEVLRTLDVERVHVVAASYGSPIAYRFAQLYPEAVDRLVLAGVMKEIPQTLRASTRQTVISLLDGRMSEFAQEVVDGLLCADPEKPVERRALARRLLIGQLERMAPAEGQRYVHNTMRLLSHAPLDLSSAPAVPALVFTGEHDVYTRPDHCREIAEAFDEATFTTIKRADHLFHIERFEATLALVDRFLDGQAIVETDDFGPVEYFRRQPATRPYFLSADSQFSSTHIGVGGSGF
jgi:pimeloyl-ACP methyl ester carboxylesterase